jgi:hypothetical protein
MIYHVLPGDAQVNVFKKSGIEGEMLVCREAFVEGDISGETLDEFFINRAAFHNDSADEDPANYNAAVASQFRKLTELTNIDEANLWFEYELFCGVNMWFCVDLLSTTHAALYRVEPIYLGKHDRFDGFGNVTPEQLTECLAQRTRLTADDIALGCALWRAFKSDDTATLRALSTEISPAFPYLSEICDAAIDRHTRPAEIVRSIAADGATDFGSIFREFRKRAGIYGYGDSQVRRLLSEPPTAAGF